ncbi:MAG: hypothetical protein ACPLRW_04700 [Moorellales bacterium]
MAVLAEQEERTVEVSRQGMTEFMFHVLRSDISELRSEVGKLSERQDAQFRALLERQDAQFKELLERQDVQFKDLLERQDQTFARLEEKIDRRIDGLYHVVIWVLVTALGSVAMGILGIVLR